MIRRVRCVLKGPTDKDEEEGPALCETHDRAQGHIVTLQKTALCFYSCFTVSQLKIRFVKLILNQYLTD